MPYGRAALPLLARHLEAGSALFAAAASGARAASSVLRSVPAIASANSSGTAFPTALNMSDSDIPCGSAKLRGSDWMAIASAALMRRGLYGCRWTSLLP